MDHLYKMPRAARTNVGNARSIRNLRRDRLPDGTDLFVSLGLAAWHQARPPQRAFFAARRTRTDEKQTGCFQALLPRFGFFEMRIAAIDDDVARIEKRLNQINGPVDRRTGFNEENYFARPFQRAHKFFRGVCREDLLATLASDKSVEHVRL